MQCASSCTNSSIRKRPSFEEMICRSSLLTRPTAIQIVVRVINDSEMLALLNDTARIPINLGDRKRDGQRDRS